MNRSYTRPALLAAVVAALGCVDRVTGLDTPDCVRRFCVLKGDTIGVIKRTDSSRRITECAWLTSDVTTCFEHPIERTKVTCVVGALNSEGV